LIQQFKYLLLFFSVHYFLFFISFFKLLAASNEIVDMTKILDEARNN